MNLRSRKNQRGQRPGRDRQRGLEAPANSSGKKSLTLPRTGARSGCGLANGPQVQAGE